MSVTLQGCFWDGTSVQTSVNVSATELVINYLSATSPFEKPLVIPLDSTKFYYIGFENNIQIFSSVVINATRQKWVYNNETFWSAVLQNPIQRNYLIFELIGTQLVSVGLAGLTSTATGTSTTLPDEFTIEWLNRYVVPKPSSVQWPSQEGGGGGTDPRVDCMLFYLRWALGDECVQNIRSGRFDMLPEASRIFSNGQSRTFDTSREHCAITDKDYKNAVTPSGNQSSDNCQSRHVDANGRVQWKSLIPKRPRLSNGRTFLQA